MNDNGFRLEGGPAFPVPHSAIPMPDGRIAWVEDYKPVDSGMTLRQYFAGEALKGLLSDQRDGSYVSRLSRHDLVKESIVFADEMVRQLQEP